ncbi:serine hydrolase domain-containing protein [Diaminobutyricimonas sp. TR449]|uniref:serine hydrolase domain-containing protein n=1 Tax=Diaminobutyricimonas sp. TR449 TaxID=2708076 RepID=UPI001420E444|nr:serine hydrolase domain-containing protein [Diaminobutyricimonas sp. TR449]
MTELLAALAERLVDPAHPETAAPAAAPGVVLALHAPGIAEVFAAGSRTGPDAGIQLPMTVDTHHDLASVTKVVATTTALLRLVCAGTISLDAEVRSFLPGFRGGQKDEITVRDLLLHRGGLQEWHPLYVAAGADDADAAARLAESLPLRYARNHGRHYSDLGFMLLGRIVAKVAAAPLPEAVGSLVTHPLGMRSTRFAHPAGEPVATSARGDQIEMTMIDSGEPYPVPYRSSDFQRWRETAITGQVNDGNAFHAFAGISGHAGLFSTVADLIRFGTALANYEQHEDLWRADTVREFFAAGPDSAQALGFRRYSMTLDGRAVDMLGHPGFTGCAVAFAPGRSIAVAVASNRLLGRGAPTPTEQLLQQALDASSATIRERAR